MYACIYIRQCTIVQLKQPGIERFRVYVVPFQHLRLQEQTSDSTGPKPKSSQTASESGIFSEKKLCQCGNETEFFAFSHVIPSVMQLYLLHFKY
jgi:hypothetical protein